MSFKGYIYIYTLRLYVGINRAIDFNTSRRRQDCAKFQTEI